MSTRNFLPQNSGEGSIGTEAKSWGSGFFTKLAVSAITTVVSVLTPAADANDSQPATTGWVRAQFQSILTTVLSACGLKYNIATNGYICFGSLFGGLILQWGYTNSISTINFPISFLSTSYIVLSDIQAASGGNILAFVLITPVFTSSQYF